MPPIRRQGIDLVDSLAGLVAAGLESEIQAAEFVGICCREWRLSQVDAADPVAPGLQGGDQVMTNEPSRAGDECPHDYFFFATAVPILTKVSTFFCVCSRISGSTSHLPGSPSSTMLEPPSLK